MQRLLAQLNSRDKEMREDALREARTLAPDELLQLVMLANHVCGMRRKRSKIAYYAVMGIGLGAGLLAPEPASKWVARIVILSIVVTRWIKTWYDQNYALATFYITTLLLETNDVRLIAPMLRLNHDTSNETLRATLKRLLPQMRADHAAQWSKEDKSALVLPLTRPEQDCDLTLACLRALEQVGDSSAVPAVRRLIEKTYRARPQDKIAIAAQECLLYLESATGKQRQAETLLRASDAATGHPEILLRPAAPTPDNSTGEQLLRPLD